MAKQIDINVHHVTRVEGHGNIVLSASDGKIEKLEWQVPEAPRFFEAMVRGRSYEDIQTIVSRICGICSVTHSFAAIKAIEDAMGITVSEQTDKLRALALLGADGEPHPARGLPGRARPAGREVGGALRRHPPGRGQDGHQAPPRRQPVDGAVGGRMTHPVTIKPGGFGASRRRRTCAS